MSAKTLSEKMEDIFKEEAVKGRFIIRHVIRAAITALSLYAGLNYLLPLTDSKFEGVSLQTVLLIAVVVETATPVIVQLAFFTTRTFVPWWLSKAR